jgi:hypothetical protein
VNALANEEVGSYLNKNFCSAYQKVGTFRIVNGQKQGGNVASYFCLHDGTVLHAIAGPVDAKTFLREARWVVETRKKAILDSHGDSNRYRALIRYAHQERLASEHGTHVDFRRYPANNTPEWFATYMFQTGGGGWGRVNLNSNQAKVHLLLGMFPLAKIDKIYKAVFEKVLNEQVSVLPVQVAGTASR